MLLQNRSVYLAGFGASTVVTQIVRRQGLNAIDSGPAHLKLTGQCGWSDALIKAVSYAFPEVD
jgi:hypothetical protein